LLFFLFAKHVNGQGRPTITGTVISAVDNKPLSGATLKIDLSTATIQTNENGYFMIVPAKSTGKITVSYVGYQTVEVSFNTSNSQPLKIILEPNTNNLAAVTVSTGFQTIPKEKDQ